MDHNFPQLQTHILSLMKQLGAAHPTVMAAFQQMHKAAVSPGALDTKTKELLALGIAIASRCDGCIAFHTSASLKAGATSKEVIETIGVAVMMGGGPSMVCGCEAFEALQQFEKGA